jgi:hypothetical protein
VTVQNRGRPAGRFDEAGRHYSGKHHIYCLKWQVIAKGNGIAVHIVAGVSGAVHDLKLFRDNIASVQKLIDDHPGKSCSLLVGKGYIGEIESVKVHLMTPQKKSLRGYLSQLEPRRIRSSCGVAW